MNKLAVFDLDSTLLDGECITIALQKINLDKEKIDQLEQLRLSCMRGETDLRQSLETRIAFFKGLSTKKLESICQEIPWNLHAQSTIYELKQRGYFTLCLSGAFRTVTRRVMRELKMDAYCSNTLEIKEGVLTGKIDGSLMHHQSKGEILSMIQSELGISQRNTIVIGDGANDLSMFSRAHKKIAFCAQPKLIEAANGIIENKDLSKVIGFAE